MASRRSPSFTSPPAVPFHEPDLSAALKAAVIDALRQAWSALRKTPLNPSRTGEEDAITHQLQRILNECHPKTGERVIAALSLFETVSRDATVTSNDGGYEKMPDFVFRPTSKSGVQNGSDWGFWVEAKIVNAQTHPVNLYVKKGVERFTAGDYAPRMPSGGLVAYVRDQSKPATALGAHAVKLVAGKTGDIGTSKHNRSRASPPMVDIELTHLWLDAT